MGKLSTFCMFHHKCFDGRILILLPAITLMLLLGLAGCGKQGPERSPVNGKITFQGKPLQFGTVMFQPDGGQPSTGAIQPDGTFQMITHGQGDGAAVGTNRVRIACFASQDPAQDPAKVSTSKGELALGKSLIPEKYSSFQMSGIKVDVRSGANEPLILNLTK